MLLSDAIDVEIDPANLKRVSDDFQSIVKREATFPGLIDALLFLLLMAKAEQAKPGTIATLTATLNRYHNPAAEPEVV